jgi:putative endonuclease
VGEIGEGIAARFLADHGLKVVARNVEVDGGELDLLAVDHGTRVAVEVRTVTSGDDPIDAVGPMKRRRVRSLAARVRASRVDFLGVRLDGDGVTIHWVPGCV